MKKHDKRNFGLDLIRAIAISSVLMYLWLGITGQWHDYFNVLGFAGVEVFFVLSGFLIGNILIKSYLAESSFRFSVIINFWNRRWMRTIPLYIFILLINIALFSINKTPINDLWKYVLFVQNIFNYNPNNHDFYGVSWSLSIEEWFYLSFPVILFMVSVLFKKLIGKVNVLFIVIAIYVIGSLVIRYIYADDSTLLWNNQFRKAVIGREDSICFGVIGALLQNIKKEFLKKWRYTMGIAGLVLMVIVFVIFIKDVAANYSGVENNVSTFSKTWLFSITSLSVLLLLPYFYYLKVSNIFLVNTVTNISKISYSLYLVHPLLLGPITSLINPYKHKIYMLVDLILLISLTLLISIVTYRYIEQFFLKIRDRFFIEKYKAI